MSEKPVGNLQHYTFHLLEDRAYIGLFPVWWDFASAQRLLKVDLQSWGNSRGKLFQDSRM